MDDTPKTEAERAQEAREQGAQMEYDAGDQDASELDAHAPKPDSEAEGE